RFAEIESKYGSLTRGVLAAPKPARTSGPQSFLWTLKNGLGELIEKLQPSADVVHGTVEELRRNPSGFRVRVNGDWMEAEDIVLAAAAGDCAKLLASSNAELADL